MPQTPKAQKLVRIPVAAERLDCSRSYVYDLHAAGELRGVYIGLKRPALRIDDDSITEFIARRTSQMPRSA